jgi:hypothetical protein
VGRVVLTVILNWKGGKVLMEETQKQELTLEDLGKKIDNLQDAVREAIKGLSDLCKETEKMRKAGRF